MSDALHLSLAGHLDESYSQSFLELPFEVPEGIARIDVVYRYSSAIVSDPSVTGGNTIDIGIFDSRGATFGKNGGFRGWSGSARDRFFIAQDEATPGYMPGLIQPGIWEICLGLYKVAPQGCDFEVEIQLTPGVVNNAAVEPVLLPLTDIAFPANASGWYRGELHCHTFNSDGDSSPLEVVRKAEALGLDFLAITDHNVLSQLMALNTIDTRLMLIPGFEVTTYRGHWNAWGADASLDFRILTEPRMAGVVAEARGRGYLISCNHPRPQGPDWVFTQVDDFDCIEVWNGPWLLSNNIALKYWESKLRQRRRISPVGGSDAHFHHLEHPAKLGTPTTWLYVEGSPSPIKLLDALRKGRVFISESPDGPRVMLSSGDAMMGDVVQAGAEGQVEITVQAGGARGSILELYTADGAVGRYDIDADDWRIQLSIDTLDALYIRAQIVAAGAPDTVRAISSPIYLDA
ncbi:MAG: phosphotransferase domain-containing protein [Chloroflexi bacterium OLB15]|nr:MAG: phosphotransferase domain-containing protein [Chloroflexi bacterium OLB15]